MGKKSGSRSTGSGGSKGNSSLSRGGSKGNSVSKATNKVSTTVKAAKSLQPGKQTTYKTVSHQVKILYAISKFWSFSVLLRPT